MITIDQAAKIVKDLNDSGNTELAMGLFAFFEERLNPHPAKITNSWIDGEQNCLDAIAYFIYELDGQSVFCDESELQNFCR